MGQKTVKKTTILSRRGIVALVLAGLIVLPSLAVAQSILPNFGAQRVGSTAMTFLKIPVGARGEGMAGAYGAISNDAFSAFWNPAGIAQISNRFQGVYVIDPEKPAQGVKGPSSSMARVTGGDYSAGFVHFEWLGQLSYNAVSVVIPIQMGAIGVNAISLVAPDMEVTTEYNPDGTGEYFSYGDALLGVTWAWEMTQNFSWGVSLKYARETLADTHMDNILIDIGTYYWTGFRDLRIGVTLKHFGPNAQPVGSYLATDANDEEYQEDFQEYSPPTEFSLGVGMTLFASGYHRLLGTAQLNHPVDNSENFTMGAEYSLASQLFLRGGMRFNTDENPWTLGAGVRIPWQGRAVSVDLSYTEYGILDEVTRLSVELSF